MPRLGLATIDISALGGSGDTVTTIDDFFFESFSAGEMHPMLTTSRTNLVLYSEAWDNASWSKNAATVEANQIASPLDLNAFTADLLKEDNTNAEHWVRSNNITASLGQTFTMSFYAKAKERTFIKANFLNSGVVSYNVWINLSNGAITSKNANLTVTTELIGSGFYRITLTAQAAATVLNLLVGLATGDANNSYAGDGSSGAYVFGAQIEQDNFVSNYIPTVGSTVSVSTTLNDTSEVWDFDGTDIMLAEDPEDEGFWEEGSNLVLNHSFEDLGSELVTNGDFSQIGSERITNGDFALNSNWNINDTFEITNGRLHCVSDGSFQYAGQGSIFEVGKTYKLTFDIVDYTSGSIRIRPSGQSPFNTYNANGTYTEYITATDATLLIERNSACDLFVDNVSVKEVGQDWGVYEDGTSTVTFEEGAVLNIDGSNSNVGVYQENVFANGKNYKIVVNMKATASFNAEILESQGASTVSTIGNVSLTTSYQEFTLYYQGTGTNDLFIHRLSSASGSNQKIYIKSASVKQVDPNDRWTLGTGWTIEDGKAVSAGHSTHSSCTQTLSLPIGQYEVSFALTVTSGGFSIKAQGSGSDTGSVITSSGVHTEIFTTTKNRSTFLIRSNDGNGVGSVDNITVREYAIKPKDI